MTASAAQRIAWLDTQRVQMSIVPSGHPLVWRRLFFLRMVTGYKRLSSLHPQEKQLAHRGEKILFWRGGGGGRVSQRSSAPLAAAGR